MLKIESKVVAGQQTDGDLVLVVRNAEETVEVLCNSKVLDIASKEEIKGVCDDIGNSYIFSVWSEGQWRKSPAMGVQFKDGTYHVVGDGRGLIMPHREAMFVLILLSIELGKKFDKLVDEASCLN